MKVFKEKVAVITGAASGIGRAIAEKCCNEGMKVIIADIDANNLSKTENHLNENGGNVISVITDVSKASDVEMLAQKTLDNFGAVHLLFNNAGIGVAGPLWDLTLNDLNWIIGVNLWGVIHGIRTFVPIMLRQDTEGHVVNTSSLDGLRPGNGIYTVTKHAIVALSESLAGELKQLKSKINVSVLCPSFVNTNIIDSEKHRPPELQNADIRELSDLEKDQYEKYRETFKQSTNPKEVAEIVFHGIRNGIFYLLTAKDARLTIKKRMNEILNAFEEYKAFKKEELT